MAKSKTVYVCSECGAESAKWIGKCPSCNQWNTYKEFKIAKDTRSARVFNRDDNSPTLQKLNEVTSPKGTRIKTGISEMDRILGGGIVPGSMILLGGEPGIGKSTLALQIALLYKHKVLYVSGEESAHQIKLRAERIENENNECYIYNETSVDRIVEAIRENKPGLLIVDSIQTLISENIESAPGTITQIRETAVILLKVAKDLNIPVILIGHINKEGLIAGPKVLEHVVDTVLYFEGDHNNFFRVLRASKNRFGSSSEIGIFEMKSNGLEEVVNPSKVLINHRGERLSGTSVAATLNGGRPLLLEIQALVSYAAYGNPQRTSTGFDQKRLNMLLAVIEKRGGFKMNQKDVFLNVVGGIKIDDPSADLSVIASVASSYFNKSLNPEACFAGEVGLTGEIRSVSLPDKRVTEALKVGFKKIFIPKTSPEFAIDKSIKIIRIASIKEFLSVLFKND